VVEGDPKRFHLFRRDLALDGVGAGRRARVVPTEPERVVFGCGFSGHGFKFASAIGEALAELVVDSRASQPIAFLRLGMNRFADRALAR
jgi:sarcosine oxidase